MLVSESPLMSEWLTHDNSHLDPSTLTLGSGVRANWHVSKCGHSFELPIRKKKFGSCPYCSGRWLLTGFNDFSTRFPVESQSFVDSPHYSSPREALSTSIHLARWECSCGFMWTASFATRSRYGCGRCRGLVVDETNNFAAYYPEVVALWDLQKNHGRPEDYSWGSSKQVFLHCGNGHSFPTSPSIYGRRKISCLYCARQKAWPGETDLKTVAPHLLTDWDYSRNIVDPQEITLHSSIQVWWLCKAKHRVFESPKLRARRVTPCAKCPQKRSYLEMLVSEHLDSCNYEYLRGFFPLRTSLGGRLQLDFWLPELRKAIEVQDFATHSKNSDKELRLYRASADEVKHGPTYHEAKRQLAKEQLDTVLLDLWEDDVRSGHFKVLLKNFLAVVE